jgi:hypothetical protein
VCCQPTPASVSAAAAAAPAPAPAASASAAAAAASTTDAPAGQDGEDGGDGDDGDEDDDEDDDGNGRHFAAAPKKLMGGSAEDAEGGLGMGATKSFVGAIVPPSNAPAVNKSAPSKGLELESDHGSAKGNKTDVACCHPAAQCHSYCSFCLFFL